MVLDNLQWPEVTLAICLLVVEWWSPPVHVCRAHYFTLLCLENYQYFHLLSTNFWFLILFYTIQFINWHVNVAFWMKWRARQTWAGGEHHFTTSSPICDRRSLQVALYLIAHALTWTSWKNGRVDSYVHVVAGHPSSPAVRSPTKSPRSPQATKNPLFFSQRSPPLTWLRQGWRMARCKTVTWWNSINGGAARLVGTPYH